MKTLVAVLAVFLLSMPGIAWAAAETAATADPRTVLTDSMNCVKGLDSFSVEVAIRFQVEMGERKSNKEMNGTIVFHGAKDFYGHLKNDEFDAEFYCNAEKQIIYLPTEKKYIEKTCSRRNLVEMMGAGPIGMGMSWLAAYLYGDAVVLDSAASIAYAGLEQPGGADSPKQHHVTIKSTQFDTEVWVAERTAPLLQRFVMDLSKGMNNGTGGTAKAVVEFGLSSWKTNVPVQDSQFVFTPAEGVTKVVPRTAQEEDQEPLLGQAAPNVAMDLLDGGKLDLASLKGKNVVVLDFFATWCGPCRMSMPTVEEVAKKYADKGVLLYFVNSSEPADVIRPFMQRLGVSAPVALDTDHKANSAYDASRIPRMAVIGKDGNVYGVHRGAGPGFREQLAAEIEAALAGKLPAPTK
jgi:thiol-disulfide isomerase/thioredoxin